MTLHRTSTDPCTESRFVRSLTLARYAYTSFGPFGPVANLFSEFRSLQLRREYVNTRRLARSHWRDGLGDVKKLRMMQRPDVGKQSATSS